MGVDVIYQKLDGMTTPTGFLAAGAAARPRRSPAAITCLRCLVSDEDNLGIRFRVHRDFYP